MPQLKQLSCCIQWLETGTPFLEHGTIYGDGVVETFIIVPDRLQGFTIRLTSQGYIDEGLAAVIFIDGNYQCNRSRINLRPVEKDQPLNKTEIDFLLRQKEKPQGGGIYMGREWRFDDHNIVLETPAGFQDSHFDDLGTIEVLVLRCKAKTPEDLAYDGYSSGEDSDIFENRPRIEEAREFSDVSGAPAAIISELTAQSTAAPLMIGPNSEPAAVEDAGLDFMGLFDGASNPYEDKPHPGGFDGTPGHWVWHQNDAPFPGHLTSTQDHHPEQYSIQSRDRPWPAGSALRHGPPIPSRSVSGPMGRRVHFDDRPVSCQSSGGLYENHPPHITPPPDYRSQSRERYRPSSDYTQTHATSGYGPQVLDSRPKDMYQQYVPDEAMRTSSRNDRPPPREHGSGYWSSNSNGRENVQRASSNAQVQGQHVPGEYPGNNERGTDPPIASHSQNRPLRSGFTPSDQVDANHPHDTRSSSPPLKQNGCDSAYASRSESKRGRREFSSSTQCNHVRGRSSGLGDSFNTVNQGSSRQNPGYNSQHIPQRSHFSEVNPGRFYTETVFPHEQARHPLYPYPAPYVADPQPNVFPYPRHYPPYVPLGGNFLPYGAHWTPSYAHQYNPGNPYIHAGGPTYVNADPQSAKPSNNGGNISPTDMTGFAASQSGSYSGPNGSDSGQQQQNGWQSNNDNVDNQNEHNGQNSADNCNEVEWNDNNGDNINNDTANQQGGWDQQDNAGNDNNDQNGGANGASKWGSTGDAKNTNHFPSGESHNQASSSAQDAAFHPTSARSSPNGSRNLYGPHGVYYAIRPLRPDEPTPDAEEEPRYDVPKEVAHARGSTKQVQPGPGYAYYKKKIVPEYKDSLEHPYARFVFKYRTKEQLSREIGITVDVEPSADSEVQEMQKLDKDSLIEMLLRMKSALGGKVPDPPTEASKSSSTDQIEVPVALEAPKKAYLKYSIPPSRPQLTKSTHNDANAAVP